MGTIVEARCGKLEGREEQGLQVFRGIPYTQPPVGARRFSAPEPVPPWAGVRKAFEFGASAPQQTMMPSTPMAQLWSRPAFRPTTPPRRQRR